MKMEPAPTVPVYGIVVEKDVDVPMRDGARLKADVFRPDDAGKFPAILNLGPYQKDKLWVPPETLEEKPNPLMNWETVNPQWWVPKGYAAVRVDGRGSGKSPGQCEPWSLAESIDFYDAIEWAAAQPWCSGKVGLSGISYFAINQWFAANHQPPSLQRDHSVGRLRRSLPRRAVPWRAAQSVHAQLVRGASDASCGGPRVPASSQRLADQHAAFLAQQQPGQRRVPGCAGAMGQDHRADVQRRQLVGHGAASARQHRSLHARGDPAQEASDPRRHPRAPVLHRGGAQRSAAVLRLLAQGHRQRRHGRAAGEARDPQGPRRDRVAARARVAARTHPMDEILFRSVGGRRRARPRIPARSLPPTRRHRARAPIRQRASARWGRPRPRPRR